MQRTKALRYVLRASNLIDQTFGSTCAGSSSDRFGSATSAAPSPAPPLQPSSSSSSSSSYSPAPIHTDTSIFVSPLPIERLQSASFASSSIARAPLIYDDRRRLLHYATPSPSASEPRTQQPEQAQQQDDKRPSAQASQQQQQQQQRTAVQTLLHEFRRDVWLAPNLVSMARLLSGPAIGCLVIGEMWEAALLSSAVSGLSDWLDGYLARRYDQQSRLGTYLDPLADKVLICSVVGALGAKGLLPLPIVALVIGRDAVLVTGTFAFAFLGQGKFGDTDGVVPAVQPSHVSKLNTVLQIGLMGLCLSHAAVGWPEEDIIYGVGALTAMTTAASAVHYIRNPPFVK